MFIPSERHWKELQSEQAAFWPLPINSGNEYAFLVKVPTHIIKAAYRLCQVTLSVATVRTSEGLVVASVFSVFDDPASPMMMSAVHRSHDEQTALIESLRLRRTIIVFFDELARPLARAQCALDPAACDSALAILGTLSERYIGAWTSLLAAVLDELDGMIDPVRAVPSRLFPALVHVPLLLSDFEVNEITVIGSHESRRFRLDASDEGYGLEQTTWHLVEHLFAPDAFHSPQVQEATGIRELIDVLGFSEEGSCLFETKAAATLTTSLERNTQRRANGIRKQVDKALDQLLGAMRNVSRSLPILTKGGDPIDLPTSARSMRHGIIIVSELLPSVDWGSIAEQLISVSDPPFQMLYVLDLRELRLLVGASKTPVGLMTRFANRFDIMKQSGSAFIKTVLDGPPPP